MKPIPRILALFLSLAILSNPAYALRTQNSQSPKVKAGLEEELQSIVSRDPPIAAAGAEEAPADSNSIHSLDLSTRARNVMRELGITTIPGLTAKTRDELLEAPNLGAGTADEIEKRLAVRGLHLRPPSSGTEGTSSENNTPSAGAEEVAVIPAADFLERYGARLTGEQTGQVQSFLKQGNHEVTLVTAPETFHLYTDAGLAAIANRMQLQQPVEAVNFDIVDNLRTRPRTVEKFKAPGLIVSDPVVGEFDWQGSPLRTLSMSVQQMQLLKPVAWIALSINRNLTVEQVLNLRSITFTDEQGRTVHAIFA